MQTPQICSVKIILSLIKSCHHVIKPALPHCIGKAGFVFHPQLIIDTFEKSGYKNLKLIHLYIHRFHRRILGIAHIL
jgi:hypothetical protein